MPNELTIGTPEEGEDADYYVCIPVTDPLAFPDNLVDECCQCGQAIQHRPHYPITPRKICLACATPDMEKDAKKGELEIMISPKTAQEVADYYRKKNAN